MRVDAAGADVSSEGKFDANAAHLNRISYESPTSAAI